MSDPNELWRQLANSRESFASVLNTLVRENEPELIKLLAQKLTSSVSAPLAIDVLLHLPLAYRVRFIRELLELASYVNGATNAARTAIFSIEHSWLLVNIVGQMNFLLQDRDGFLAMFQLAKEIDVRCAREVLGSVHALNIQGMHEDLVEELRREL